MRGRGASEVLALPVRLHGIQLGKPVGVFVDRLADRVLGFEIACGDGAQSDLAFYRRNSRRLADMGLADPWIDEDGNLHEARSAA